MSALELAGIVVGAWIALPLSGALVWCRYVAWLRRDDEDLAALAAAPPAPVR
jgi:hypothetical protein